MEKMQIKFYRHKTYRDIYLKRNWNICGSPDAEWWKATNDLIEALNSMKRYKEGKDIWVDVEEAYHEHYFENGHSRLKAKITLKKEFDFDGYVGELKKELILPLDDFELVTLEEN